MKLTNRICAFLLFFCSFSYGQMMQYDYKRELKDVSHQWHKIVLTDEIFGKTSQNLNDIRIFGITASSDTVEAPYLLRLTTEEVARKEVAFKTLNAASNAKGYFFTFEIPTVESINQINLEFKQQNFDWPITLEGSQNQSEWYTVLENYRILSISNELTDFQFTKLAFPSSKYRYFRLLIDSKEKPELTKASIAQREETEGTFRNYPVRRVNTKENKQLKHTEIDVKLEMPVRASRISIVVSDTFDYYRPVTIQCLTDSFRTEQGWKYNYKTLTSGTLNSIEENEFRFNSTTIQYLKILVHNQDNQPLSPGAIEVKGYVHELVVRFAEDAKYYLTYGNKSAARPQYDIERFVDQIPKTLTTLELGKEQKIAKAETPAKEPLFKSQIWLWTIMSVIIVLLGWFSITMIRKN